jgi:hypothetical protein
MAAAFKEDLTEEDLATPAKRLYEPADKER